MPGRLRGFHGRGEIGATRVRGHIRLAFSDPLLVEAFSCNRCLAGFWARVSIYPFTLIPLETTELRTPLRAVLP